MQQILPFAPMANSGANSQNPTIVVNLDTISVVRKLGDDFSPQMFINLLREICDQFHVEYSIDWDSQRGKKPGMYHHFASSTNRIMFWWSELDPSTGEGDCRIEFTGTSLQETDLYDEILLVTGLLNRGFRATRLDPNFDDYGKRLDPNWIIHAGTQKWIPYEPDVQFQGTAGKPGWTVYIGGRNSEKRIRFYDKSVQSKGQINAYRFEAQLRKSFARELGETLKAMGAKILKKKLSREEVNDFMAFDLLEYIIGLFRFVIPKEGDKNKSRGDVPEFWKDYCDYLAATPNYIKVQRSKVPLEQQQKWFDKSTPRYLAKFAEIHGEEKLIDNIIELIEFGKTRFTGFDKAEIRQHKRKHKSPEIPIRWAS